MRLHLDSPHSLNMFEQNTPVLTITRKLGCCGHVYKVSFIASEREPNPYPRAEREMALLMSAHVCPQDVSEQLKAEATA